MKHAALLTLFIFVAAVQAQEISKAELQEFEQRMVDAITASQQRVNNRIAAVEGKFRSLKQQAEERRRVLNAISTSTHDAPSAVGVQTPSHYFGTLNGQRMVYVNYETCTGPGCWRCPQCGKYHCGPRPQGQRPPEQSPEEDFPQYESRPPETHPPVVVPPPDDPRPPLPLPPPPDNPGDIPPAEPEPTVDEEELEKFKQDFKAEITNEVSVLVEAAKCDCEPKWSALELRLTAIEQRLMDVETANSNQQTVNDANLAAWEDQRTINTNIDNSVRELSEAVENVRFQIRVVDPRGLYTTPYAEVTNGKKVDLIFSPLSQPIQ